MCAVDRLLRDRRRHRWWRRCGCRGKRFEGGLGRGIWLRLRLWLRPWSGLRLRHIQFCFKTKALRRDDFCRATVKMFRFVLRDAAGGLKDFGGSCARKIRRSLCRARRGSVSRHGDGHVREIELSADIIERLEKLAGVGEALTGCLLYTSDAADE